MLYYVEKHTHTYIHIYTWLPALNIQNGTQKWNKSYTDINAVKITGTETFLEDFSSSKTFLHRLNLTAVGNFKLLLFFIFGLRDVEAAVLCAAAWVGNAARFE